MEKDKFKKMFDNFTAKPGKTMMYQQSDLDTVLAQWKAFFDIIITYNETTKDGGLPFEKWVKYNIDGDNVTKPEEYLPAFANGIKVCGRSRIGEMSQVKIYRNSTVKDPRYGYFYSAYSKSGDLPQYLQKEIEVKDDTNYYSTEDTPKQDYNEHIKPLLYKIVSCKKIIDLVSLEGETEYNDFSSKQILRRISLLVSLMDDKDSNGDNTYDYYNDLIYIYNDKKINDLYDMLFENDADYNPDKTFLFKNNAICKRAKEWCDFNTSTYTLKNMINLNYFLWYLCANNISSDFTTYNVPNVIFHGAPGTGKTYTIMGMMNLLCEGDTSRYKKCQFHPSYTYQDFIEGIKPSEIDGDNVRLKITNGTFKQFCIYVKNENENFVKNHPADKEEFEKYPHYYFIVDEINRGNLSSIFGEILTLLEKDYRDYDFSGNYTEATSSLLLTPMSNVIENLKDDGEKGKLAYKIINNKIYFGIPFNIHFIGMMNDVDKSIDTFDLALRRRFKWIQTKCDYDLIVDALCDKEINDDDITEYKEDCKKLNEYITKTLNLGENYQFGHSFFMKLNAKGTITKKNKEVVFNNYILPTLTEYIREVKDADQISSCIEEAKKAFGL